MRVSALLALSSLSGPLAAAEPDAGAASSPWPLSSGGSVTIRMRRHYDLVRDLGWKEGAIDESSFFLAYFFPRVTNYSDYGGWDTKVFTMGREFNNDFADFEVEVTSPRDNVIWATGELQNPDEVLQPAVARSLKASRTSDRLWTIAEPDDVRSGRVTARAETLTWKWRAANVPDFAIAPAAWQTDPRTTEVAIASARPLQSVMIDTGIFVDFNSSDNSWKP